MIESVEEDWDVTYIMVKGRIARVCHRTDLEVAKAWKMYISTSLKEARRTGHEQSCFSVVKKR